MAPSGELKIRYRRSNLMLNCLPHLRFESAGIRPKGLGNGLVMVIDSTLPMQVHGISATTELSAACKWFRVERS